MAELTSLKFDSLTMVEMSNEFIGDGISESLIDENIRIDEDVDDMLQVFNDILFNKDDDLKVDTNKDVSVHKNGLKEKETFEIFSDLLKELEEEGEDLNPILIGSELDVDTISVTSKTIIACLQNTEMVETSKVITEIPEKEVMTRKYQR